MSIWRLSWIALVACGPSAATDGTDDSEHVMSGDDTNGGDSNGDDTNDSNAGVSDPCAGVTPTRTSNGSPVFSGGDPCEEANPRCAWDAAQRRCATFVAVPECPPALDEAEALRVSCDHSGQATLACTYADADCGCERTPYCGGARPPPDVQYPPAYFRCVPHLDSRGCPSSPPERGARCSLAADVNCNLGCYDVFQCRDGHWHHERLPPRP